MRVSPCIWKICSQCLLYYVKFSGSLSAQKKKHHVKYTYIYLREQLWSLFNNILPYEWLMYECRIYASRKNPVQFCMGGRWLRMDDSIASGFQSTRVTPKSLIHVTALHKDYYFVIYTSICAPNWCVRIRMIGVGRWQSQKACPLANHIMTKPIPLYANDIWFQWILQSIMWCQY